ncbi:MAG: glycosyltransferase [Clostridium sp.]|nr:glycosyltransferase [Clostridium sp.]
MKITGCVLAKNEGDKLEKCLSDLFDISDEVILVDNGSTDNTQEIAKRFGCKIIYSPDLVLDEARNRYLEEAKYPWIFILDTDERITEEGKREIKRAVEEADESVAGFQLPRYEYVGDGKWSYTVITRLIRNHPKIRYEDFKIHARLRHSVQSVGKVELLNAPIHHFDSFYKNRNSQKRQKYINLILDNINNTNDSRRLADLYKYLGLEYNALGRIDEAKIQYNKSIELDSEFSSLCKLYLTFIYIQEGNLDLAESTIDSLLDLNTNMREKILNAKSKISFEKGKIDEAMKSSLEAIEAAPFLAHNYINVAALLENKNPLKAMEYLNKAIELNPYVLDEFIYKKVSTSNIYLHQDAFLSCTRSVNSHMEKCKANIEKQKLEKMNQSKTNH